MGRRIRTAVSFEHFLVLFIVLFHLLIYFGVFVAACRLSPVAVSRDYSPAIVFGFLMLQSAGSRAHRLQ